MCQQWCHLSPSQLYHRMIGEHKHTPCRMQVNPGVAQFARETLVLHPSVMQGNMRNEGWSAAPSASRACLCASAAVLCLVAG
jgi:hypothetical protein